MAILRIDTKRREDGDYEVYKCGPWICKTGLHEWFDVPFGESEVTFVIKDRYFEGSYPLSIELKPISDRLVAHLNTDRIWIVQRMLKYALRRGLKTDKVYYVGVEY